MRADQSRQRGKDGGEGIGFLSRGSATGGRRPTDTVWPAATPACRVGAAGVGLGRQRRADDAAGRRHLAGAGRACRRLGPRRSRERLDGLDGRSSPRGTSRLTPGPSPAGGPDASVLAALDDLKARVDAQGRLLEAIARHVGDSTLRTSPTAPGARQRASPRPRHVGRRRDLIPVEHPDALWKRLGLTEGERRNVTVLFADVSGFTALSEQIDDEDFQLVMRDTMAAIVAVITHQDGYVEKFIGDAVCAIFARRPRTTTSRSARPAARSRSTACWPSGPHAVRTWFPRRPRRDQHRDRHRRHGGRRQPVRCRGRHDQHRGAADGPRARRRGLRVRRRPPAGCAAASTWRTGGSSRSRGRSTPSPRSTFWPSSHQVTGSRRVRCARRSSGATTSCRRLRALVSRAKAGDGMAVLVGRRTRHRQDTVARRARRRRGRRSTGDPRVGARRRRAPARADHRSVRAPHRRPSRQPRQGRDLRGARRKPDPAS